MCWSQDLLCQLAGEFCWKILVKDSCVVLIKEISFGIELLKLLEAIACLNAGLALDSCIILIHWFKTSLFPVNQFSDLTAQDCGYLYKRCLFVKGLPFPDKSDLHSHLYALIYYPLKEDFKGRKCPSKSWKTFSRKLTKMSQASARLYIIIIAIMTILLWFNH